MQKERKDKKKLHVLDHTLESQSVAAAATTKEIFRGSSMHSLSAWLHCFDQDHNNKIDFEEFCVGMQKLGFDGDIVKLWKDMDLDGSGVLTFDEIDVEGADMWASFRRWAGSTFDSARDMITQLNRSAGKSGQTLKQKVFQEEITKFGWEGSLEHVLYHSLDVEGVGFLSVKQLKWLDVEKRRQMRKLTARMRAQHASEKHMKSRIQACRVLNDFKTFLKQEYGHLFRAWRKCIDLDGSMSVQKAELFKACCYMRWKGDVRCLWDALDGDGSGCTTLEEVDPDCANLLAKFKQWADANWGSARPCFRALDRHRARRLKKEDFVESCKRFGFTNRPKTLFTWLDWDSKKYLTEEDFECLDAWRPSAWLLASPNEDAVKEIKNMFYRKYEHFVKAWRMLLDKDNSNRVNWHEWEEACKKIGYRGDVPGAWLALDEDLSGYITMAEIDKESFDTLSNFKSWADKEFGGVQSAFWVLDNDGSGELTFREFRRATRDFGFVGDSKHLFECLDCDSTGRLSIDEVKFLDAWDVSNPQDIRRWALIGGEGLPPPAETLQPSHVLGEELLDYNTGTPAPNTYEILPTLGARSTMPLSQFSGGCVMKKPTTGRLVGRWRDSQKQFQTSMSPAKYKPNVAQVKHRKPAWGFGCSKREPQYLAKPDAGDCPGPGQYDEAELASAAPQISLTPRRRLNVHPEQKHQSIFTKSF
eukprot:gnl/MRDRNA2_/MRDRNA2_168035_c0_seq1.p1 gnl/MRDRNA2_/MRDRNA2_168035_c0~~gnl/MRDRNA2_/MRDRNA2_168035_c0_seq1.p1  ORF type:complete len:701 (+),score=152.66 gnl/MRDRNA2_/MRDRNA2_168035_c0_seq1:157-2259(+)